MPSGGSAGRVHGVNGPVVRVALPSADAFFVGEVVRVGARALAGEVISLRHAPRFEAVAQVYENTAGLRVGEAVRGTGAPLSVRVAPGWVGHIFDGVGRRLDDGAADKKYPVRLTARPGDRLNPGDSYAEAEETPSITYKALLPPGAGGTVASCVPDGTYAADEPLITLAPSPRKGAVSANAPPTAAFSLAHTRPVRAPFPVHRRLPPAEPLITGTRVIDSLFPLAKGGAAMLPGGFGVGKTMTLHQIAKHCDADLICYIGCGERGNEMAQALEEFSALTDPRTGASLLARTILIANTSDMPVSAREASIYTGLTVAEAYRDMGCHVLVCADSTSRWAEAARELSARLEEMPAEEGYPAALAARLAVFYERAGAVENRNATRGSITIIGAVSPQGADFTEPVTQITKRFVRVYWALERRLAYARHFPAIDWLTSYSDYDLLPPQAAQHRNRLLEILRDEARVQEITRILGTQDLSPSQRETLRVAKRIRQNFLQQNALDPADACTPPHTQQKMLAALLGEA